MIVLVRFVSEGKTKTLFNEFKIKTIKTPYREPIDDNVVRLLASKMAFDNQASKLETWFGRLPDEEYELTSREMDPILKKIGSN